MNQKGSIYEVAFAVIILALIISFYATDLMGALPVLLLLLGAGMILAGMIFRDQSVAAFGIIIIGLAIAYSKLAS